MRRLPVLISLIALILLGFGCSPKITPQEAKVLVSLDEIQRGVEANIEYENFMRLLRTAGAEIELLKQSKNPNPCFQRAIEKCYASYEIAGKAWKKGQAEKNENRKADLEMALSFSMSFSAINIKRANNCYN